MQLLTAPGVAGVAVVRVPPAERAAVVAALRTGSGAPVALVAGQPPRRALLQLAGRSIDDVLVLDRGALGLELHLHGAPMVIEQLAAAFPFEPAPAVAPAEQLLRDAQSVEQFDFAHEQLAFDFGAELAALTALPAAARAGAIAAMRRRSRVARALCRACRVVLIGCQNAGKSSLLNRLLFRERALTGAEPGLTRDPIAERTTLGGYPYELIDTAGEGACRSPVDAAAVVRGRALRCRALVVLVVDAARGPGDLDRQLRAMADLVVANKRDLVAAPWPGDLPRHAVVSADVDSSATLRHGFGELLRTARRLPPAGPVGGPAALSDAQRRALLARADDCRPPRRGA